MASWRGKYSEGQSLLEMYRPYMLSRNSSIWVKARGSCPAVCLHFQKNDSCLLTILKNGLHLEKLAVNIFVKITAVCLQFG